MTFLKLGLKGQWVTSYEWNERQVANNELYSMTTSDDIFRNF